MGTRPWEGEWYAKPNLDHAVSWVSWHDAVEFCWKLSAKEGRDYRLPSEAAWEYASRAGSGTRYCFGDADPGLGDFAWHSENAGYTDKTYAHAVGLKRANAWGLYDMHGDVGEWCSDWHDPNYYESSLVGNPTEPSNGSVRVWRGGGWSYDPGYCRSADRDGVTPGIRGSVLGFRVAVVPAE